MNQPLPAEDNRKGERPPSNILPFKPIRQETVLSKLPIHNLAKKGTLPIHIVKNNPAGKTEFHWEVIPNPTYGEPRALAYKLDTILINRRIDQLGRPLPDFVRLGSLRELNKELRLGGDTNKLKKALRQNAHTVIRAKFKYTGRDGTEYEAEFESTRYGIVFTGEKLPNGKKADAAYITLNPPYRRILNKAEYRPLNYDYLHELGPAAQRWYELASYKMFATLKNKLPSARLRYSKYCEFSPQERYSQLWKVKRQMKRIHAPHMESNYITAFWYEKATTPDGLPDWDMHYQPGPKARDEYEAFTGRKIPEPQPPETPQEDTKGVGEPAPPDPDHLKALTDRGVSGDGASKIATDFSGDFDLQLAYIDDRVEAKRAQGTLENPAGFYISGFGLDKTAKPWDVPEDFKARHHHHQQEHAQEDRRELEAAYYGSYIAPAIEAWIAQNQTEYQQLLAAARQLPTITNSISEAVTEKLASIEVRSQIEEKLNLTSFEEWKRTQEAGDYHPIPTRRYV